MNTKWGFWEFSWWFSEPLNIEDELPLLERPYEAAVMKTRCIENKVCSL